MSHSVIIIDDLTGEQIGLYYPPHEGDRTEPRVEMDAVACAKAVAASVEPGVMKVRVTFKGKGTEERV